ncbi:MAG: DUF86 domain-containing protein [Desulfuromonadaceae bacterium]|nr:DUF86 domain-containing protein [Desulfuromonadaceae bacterium]
MFNRDIRLYLDDMDEAIAAIESYTTGLDFQNFVDDRKTYSATLREFILIGEAIANIPDTVKEQAPAVAWRQIKDFRNFIVHEYFGIDAGIVWDAARLEIPLLKAELKQLRQKI